MAPTLAVSGKTLERLMRVKGEENAQSIDDLLEAMITQYRSAKLREAQNLFQERMRDKGLAPQDINRP